MLFCPDHGCEDHMRLHPAGRSSMSGSLFPMGIPLMRTGNLHLIMAIPASNKVQSAAVLAAYLLCLFSHNLSLSPVVLELNPCVLL